MLLIRAAQLEALTRPVRELFIERARRDLDQLFPGDVRLLDATASRELIMAGMERGEALGITHTRELLLFVFLVFELGLGFEDDSVKPWIGKLLRDPALRQAEKMDVIYTRLAIAAGGATP